MRVAETLRAKLEAAFSSPVIDIVDESHKHAGHAGARPEGESHFRVSIVAAEFNGLNRIARHRLVHDVLAQELQGPVHALVLSLRTPEELDYAT